MLIDDFWPDDYFDVELFEQIDLINKEVQLLRNSKDYDNFIKESDIKINQDIRLELMKGIRLIYELSEQIALKLIDEFKLPYKTFTELDIAIKHREFDKAVQVEREKAKQQINKKQTFEEMCVPFMKIWKMTIDRNITVAQFIALEKSLKAELANG